MSAETLTAPLPISQPCGCPIGDGHYCEPPFAHKEAPHG